MDALGTGLLPGPPEPDDHSASRVPGQYGREVFPHYGHPDHDTVLCHLIHALTGVPAVYRLDTTDDGDGLIVVVSWRDEDEGIYYSRVVLTPVAN